jgi:hypothetical protein
MAITQKSIVSTAFTAITAAGMAKMTTSLLGSFTKDE